MYRILVADDEMIERKVLIKRLHEMFAGQLELFEAENGREVLNIYADKRTEILLLDIEMPGVTGLEAAEQIRCTDPNCCIIFLTAFDEFSYARRAISVHALDYLLKPCDEKELLLVLEAAMKHVDDVARQNGGTYPELRKKGEDASHAGTGESVLMQTGIGGRTGEKTGSVENESGWQLRNKILNYIQNNYMKDISVQGISEDLNYSEAYFCKLFKQEFGQSFVTYLTLYRVDQARKQLAMPAANIRDIGRAVGYPDPNYFAKVFRRAVGMSPSDYRSQLLRM